MSAKSPCPERDEWSAYSLGKVSPQQEHRLAAHLVECNRCVAVLDTLSDVNDPLIRELKKPIGPDPYERESACQRARQSSAELSLPAADGLGRVRDYHIVARIAEGGMGTVYKAEHTRLKRVVALKLMHPHLMTGAGAVARFQREMEAIGRLDHPHLVRATDAGEDQGRHYLVMELVEGLDLSQLVDRCGPLSLADAAEMIVQAAAGLQHAHEHGLVHRDIKPSNLVLSRQGQVKVLDLGLALLRSSGAEGELTSPGQLMGTVDYMAPEQARDTHRVDIRADIYSLGCTLYKLLSAKAPFAGPEFSTPFEKMLAHSESEPPALTQYRDDLPKSFLQVLAKMMAKKPDDRHATPSESAEALRCFAGGADLGTLLTRVGLSPSSELAATESLKLPPKTSGRSVRRRMFAAALLGLGAILMLAAAIALFPRTPLSTTSSAGWISLLPSDPSALNPVGRWEATPEGLVVQSSGQSFSRLELDFDPPAEYDFRVEFAVHQGSGEVFQVFPVNDVSVRWAMWSFDYRQFAFVYAPEVAPPAPPGDNPTAQPFARLESRKRYVSLLEVRGDRVRAHLDGRRVAEWVPVHADISPCGQHQLPHPRRLGLGAWDSRVVFHAVDVRPFGTAQRSPLPGRFGVQNARIGIRQPWAWPKDMGTTG